MTCAELEDRLFDEDCRAALLGRAVTPLDVAAHAASCPACARRWAEAATDMQRLNARLVTAPPPALLRRLHRALRPRAGARTAWVDSDTLSWVIAGGAVGASLAGAAFGVPRLPEWAGFCLGASVGLTLAVLLVTRRSWLAPVGPLRYAALRFVAAVVQVI